MDRSQGKPYAIPSGEYPVTIEKSPKFSALYHRDFLTPHVNNVPGFTGIEIHIGNVPRDTEGCTLVGEIKGAIDCIGNSEIAFRALMGILTRIGDEPITIAYIDPMPVTDPEIGL